MTNPITHVETFDGSLGDFTGTGPERYDNGLCVEEGATNLITTPLTPAMFGYAHLTLSNVTGTSVDHPLGGHSDRYKHAEVTSSAGFASQFGVSATLPSPPALNTVFTGSVLMRFSAGRIGDTVNLKLGQRTGAGAITLTTTVPYVVTGDWQLFTDDITMDTADRTAIYIYVDASVAADQEVGSTFDAVFADVRQKPYSTSACPSVDSSGAILSGYTWSGTAHASTSTRAASSAAISPAGIFDTYLGAIVFVATPTIETGAEEIWGELGEKLAGADHIRWGRDSTKHPFVEWSGNDSAYTRVTLTATVDAGDEHFYSIEWHVGEADFRLYLDDDPSENDTIPSPQEDYGAGPLKLQATAGGVIYGGLAICNERLTNDQRARLKVVMENRGNIETALDSKRGRYGFFQVRPKVE